MAIFSTATMLAMLPKTGGVHLGWEKKPAQNGNQQVIEVKISPDHLDRCREMGVCVDGCPSREFLFVGHLLIRK
jgi:ferredoxin